MSPSVVFSIGLSRSRHACNCFALRFLGSSHRAASGVFVGIEVSSVFLLCPSFFQLFTLACLVHGGLVSVSYLLLFVGWRLVLVGFFFGRASAAVSVVVSSMFSPSLVVFAVIFLDVFISRWACFLLGLVLVQCFSLRPVVFLVLGMASFLVVYFERSFCLAHPLLSASCAAVFPLRCAVCRIGLVFLLPPQAYVRLSVLVFLPDVVRLLVLLRLRFLQVFYSTSR